VGRFRGTLAAFFLIFGCVIDARIGYSQHISPGGYQVAGEERAIEAMEHDALHHGLATAEFTESL